MKIALVFLLLFITFMSIINESPKVLVFGTLFAYSLGIALRDKDLLSPFALFSLTPLSAMIYSSEVSWYFLPPLNLSTLFVMLFGMLSFLLGMRTTDLVYTNSKFLRVSTNQYWRHDAEEVVRLLLLLGVIPHILGILTVGIPLLSVATARSRYLPNIIGNLTILIPIAVFLSFSLKKRKTILAATILGFSLALVRVAKSDIAMILFAILSGFYWFRSKGSLLKKALLAVLLVLSLALVLCSFSWFGSLRTVDNELYGFTWLETTYIYRNFFASVPNILKPLTMPYMYFVTSWSNLDYQISTISEYRFGLMTLRPILSWLQIDRFATLDYSMRVRRSAFNTFSFIADFFTDFGLIGVVVLSFVLGLFVRYIYKRSKLSDDLLVQSEYLLVGYATMMMFFSNHFVRLSYPFLAIIVIEFLRIVLRRGTCRQGKEIIT